MWVEFIVGSRPWPERFFSGYSGFPIFKNQHFQISIRSVLLSSTLKMSLWLVRLHKHSPCYWHSINYLTTGDIRKERCVGRDKAKGLG